MHVASILICGRKIKFGYIHLQFEFEVWGDFIITLWYYGLESRPDDGPFSHSLLKHNFSFFPFFSLQLLAAATATRRKTFCSRVFFCCPAAVSSFRDCYYALRFFVKCVSHRVLTMEILCEFSNLYSKLNQTEASTIMDGVFVFAILYQAHCMQVGVYLVEWASKLTKKKKKIVKCKVANAQTGRVSPV